MEPVHALRGELIRQRRQGVPFFDAWESALPTALECAHTAFDMHAWEAALAATRGAWRASYMGAPATRGVIALEQLAETQAG